MADLEPRVSVPPRERRANKNDAKESRKGKQPTAAPPPPQKRPRRNVPEKAYYADRAPVIVQRRQPIVNPRVPRLEGQDGE